MTDLLSKYGGKSFQSLPTPSFVLQQEKFDRNCKLMLNSVHDLSQITGKEILFRAHIKTHKTAQGTFKQLGFGIPSSKMTSNSILISTMKEAHGLLDFQESLGKDYVKDICYSMPAGVIPALEQLSILSRRVESLRIFVDHLEHLDNLVRFGLPASKKKWSVFIKVDMGTQRAGLNPQSEEFLALLRKAISHDVSEVVELYGFYAHAGHSYSSDSIEDAHEYLIEEIEAVNYAAQLLTLQAPGMDLSKLVLSVGATPTSNALRVADESKLTNIIQKKLQGVLEIHCGNYCVYDLQQLSTGCIKDYDISGFVLGSVFSSYEARNEILTDTGVMVLTREASKVPGRGLCVRLEDILYNEPFNYQWYVDRVSQEHGILKPYENSGARSTDVKIGSKIAILPQHACIVMGQFPYYFVVDKDGTVTDMWTPFQKW
ncbi:probable D-serine dehydratase [Zygosaccharomyces bailii]|nr:probable D-serine dehydratase [Zygosaccharomyces bailii]